MIPFSPPLIDDDVIKEVMDSLTSGWITTGPKVKALELEVAKLTGIENVLCVNSATSALMLMLHWYGIGKGDEVIVPAYTYCATALSVMHVGAKPVMADVGKDFCLDTQKLKSLITEKTKAIIPVDIAGYPCDYNEIHKVINDPEVLKKFIPANDVQEKLGRIYILSDAAHSIGATYNGKPSAQMSDTTVFSFHAVKNVTTAEGGAICINLPPPFDNDGLYKWLRLLSLNGQTKDAFTKSQGGNWRYDIVYPGFKINLNDICAAVGLAQIRKYEQDLLEKRRKIFEAYDAAFSATDWAELPPEDAGERISSCHIYLLRFKGITEDQRDRMIDVINELGVAVNVHFVPMPMLKIFRERDYNIDDFPVSYDNYSRVITLPVYPQLTDEDISKIIQAVKSAYTRVTAGA
jgi:dTDP-4-amino-4,6-dideoxygalactose transaminase